MALPVAGHPVLGPDTFSATTQLKWAPMVAAPFIIPMVLALAVMRVLAPDGTGFIAMMICLGGMATSISAMVLCYRPLIQQGMRSMKARVWKDVEARSGPISLSSEYVGVSFTPERWSLNGDTSWDFGALSTDLDRIRFRGRKVDFDLTQAQILRVDIRKTLATSTGHGAMLYVTWLDEGGTEQFVVLEPRDAKNTNEFFDDLYSLRDRIVALRDGPRFPSTENGELPPKSSEMPLSQSPLASASLNAKRLGGALGILVTVAGMVFVAVTGVLFFGNPLSFLSGICWVAGFVVFAVSTPWIDKRLPERWKGIPAKDSPALDSHAK